jgi:hypothetical protein
LTFYKAPLSANSPEVKANKALTIDPSVVLVILSCTLLKTFLAYLI